MLYLRENFHQKIRQHAIAIAWTTPHYIFSFKGHFFLSLQCNFVLLL